MIEGAYWQLLHYSIHLLVYFLFNCWQSLSWRVLGIHRRLVDGKKSENYEKSAQVLKVWSRSRMMNSVIPRLRHFLTSHVRFVHPEFVLQKHIAMLSITSEYVLFSVPQNDVDVYDMRKWPFLHDAVFEEAEYIVTMPIESFNKLASSLPPTKATVLWIYHTGRCGSTALGQAFNSLPDAVAMSEPMTFTALLHCFKDRRLPTKHGANAGQQYRTLFRSLVCMSLKPSLKSADIIVIKSAPLNAFADFELLSEMFPQIKVMFMYRDVMPQVTSLYKLMEGEELVTVISRFVAGSPFLSKLFPKVTAINSDYNRCYLSEEHVQWMANQERIQPIDNFMAFVTGFAELCYHYKIFIQRDSSSMLAFKFEYFMSEKRKQLSALFNYIGVEFTEERWLLMEKAFELDSQLKSFASRDKVAKRTVTITPEMTKEADRCLDYFNLPSWGEMANLPNTVL